MKKHRILLLLFVLAFLAGCNKENAVINKPISNQNANLNIAIDKEITLSETSGEIANPNLKSPADINSGQIQKYFELRGVYYALAMQSSMNILLETPTSFKPQFVGVLRANKEDAAWTKFIEIKDNNATDKNNPYYLWPLKNQLRLSVVDQNGAGSGEGIMKLFLIADDKATLSGCYYYPGTPTEIDYFSNTRNISKFESQPMETCNTVQINLIK